MISPGWLPMFVGFGLTSLLVGIQDMRQSKVHDLAWVPLVAGFMAFFWGGSPRLLLSTLTFSIEATLCCWLTLWLVDKAVSSEKPTEKEATETIVGGAKFGHADWIAVALYSLWPLLMIGSIVSGLVIGIAGDKLGWWNRGRRAIPLAGLMALFSLIGLLSLAML